MKNRGSHSTIMFIALIGVLALSVLGGCTKDGDAEVTPTATVTPTVEPGKEPAATATPVPTDAPTPEPTATATPVPTDTPTPEPTAEPTRKVIKMPDYAGFDYTEAMRNLQALDIEVSINIAPENGAYEGYPANGQVMSQLPAAGEDLIEGDKVILYIGPKTEETGETKVDTGLDNVNKNRYLDRIYDGVVVQNGTSPREKPGTYSKDKNGEKQEKKDVLKTADGKEVVLKKGDQVKVYGERYDDDMDVWYHISCTVDGQEYVGYVYFGRIEVKDQ